jgi:3-dehydroquinate synthase class II
MDTEVSQGRFNVRRDLSGRIRIECPPLMVIPCDVAVQMATAILQTAGAEVIFSDPGSTVIRGGNGNGKVIR